MVSLAFGFAGSPWWPQGSRDALNADVDVAAITAMATYQLPGYALIQH